MVLFKNPNYCFDEDSLLLLFGVILKEFECMAKDYKSKQCLLTVDTAKQCLISMGTGSGAQCIVLQQMQSIISSSILNGKLSNQQLLRTIMPQSIKSAVQKSMFDIRVMTHNLCVCVNCVLFSCVFIVYIHTSPHSAFPVIFLILHHITTRTHIFIAMFLF
eukprot:1008451_1